MNILRFAEQYVERNDTNNNRDDFWFSHYYKMCREEHNMDVYHSVLTSLSMLYDTKYVTNFLEEYRTA